jgi:hypothetical protein
VAARPAASNSGGARGRSAVLFIPGSAGPP